MHHVFKHALCVLFAGIVSVSMMAQNRHTVTGVVTDENANPFPGVAVMVEGTTVGSLTEANGTYTITAAPQETLVFTCIGYKDQRVLVGNMTSLNIQMEPDVNLLDETVVIGYGVARKRDVTGSIANVKGEQIVKAQNFSALESLRGKASGVTVLNDATQGFNTPRVIIRGTATINASSDPLYVVDGVAMENFGLVNPNDIESIEVLKDASAAAIYGARGANGVILVTTKRGDGGQDGGRISYQGSVSIGQMARYMDAMNAQEWCDTFMAGLANENKWNGMNWSLNPADWFTDRTYFDASGKPLYDTDWQKESTRTTISHNHQINVQQKGKNSSTGAFLNYTDRQGLLINTYTKRASGKLTFDANPTKWLTTNINLMVNHTYGRHTPQEAGGQEAIRTMIEMLPWLPVYEPGTNKYTTNASPAMSYGFEGMANPVMILDLQKRRRSDTQIFGNAAFTFHLLPGLDLKTQLGIDAHTIQIRYYSPTNLTNLSAPDGRAEFTSTNTFYWQEETYLTYNKVFDDHRINAMAGLSWQERTYMYNYARTRGFTTDFFEDYNMGVGTDHRKPASEHQRWAMNSYFLRLAYTFKDRYSITATGRYDGSSKFGENHKYGFFPSAGFAWMVSQEDFMKNAKSISHLKLHTSYGLTGNSEIGVYRSLSSVESSTTLINNVSAPYSRISSMANSDLRWEKTAQFDVGFDVGFFKDRVNLDVSYYHKFTSDLLLNCPVVHSTGFSSVMKNIGSVKNDGLDFMLNAYPIDNKTFTWNTTLNLNYNKNVIVHLGETDADIEENSWVSGANTVLRVGEPISAFYGYERYGVWTVEDAQAGKCSQAQIGRPHRSEGKIVTGKGVPDWNGSWINTFNYKGFDLTADLQFVYGVEVQQRYFHPLYDRFGITNGLTAIYKDAYDGTNPNTMQQAIRLCNSGHAGQDTKGDTAWVCDGSYLRLNMMQLGYTFGKAVTSRLGINALRTYISGSNLFLLCSKDYLGYDPEAGSGGGNFESVNSRGQNTPFYSYPRARTFTFGVNVTF
ncbi:MAG: TonB-dependent receptor [Bacteroidales bacterium]|nr:TonB-dependent receptor [Bacteroidales bacterium]